VTQAAVGRAVSFSRGRSTITVIAGQAISSGSNFLVPLVASLMLSVEEFSSFVVALSVGTVITALVRAAVGLPLLAHGDSPGLGDAVTAGVLVAVLAFPCMIALSLAGPGLFGDARWIGLALPFALLQDVYRYVLLARSEVGATLVADVIWFGVQLLVGVVLLLALHPSAAVIALSWGAGALVSLFYCVARTGVAPRIGRPRGWVRAARGTSGWYFLVAGLGQSQLAIVIVLLGVLFEPVVAAGLRLVQMLAVQPATVLAAGLSTLLVPRIVAAGWRGLHAVQDELRRSRRLVGLLTLAPLLLVPIAPLLLDTIFAKYREFSGLVLPLCLQAALLLAATLPQSRLLAAERGPAMLGIQLIDTTAMIGLSLGIGVLAGPVGVAWGFAASGVMRWLAYTLVARTRNRSEHR